MTDKELAEAVHAAVKEFDKAIYAAHEAGLRVELDQIDVTTFNDSLASPEPVMMWCARVYLLVRTDY